MDIYIPKDALRNKENGDKIRDILNKILDSDLRIEGIPSIEDAVEEIKKLGEDEIANLITG